MCSLFASAAWCLARPVLLSSMALSVASVLWLALNGSLEGRVLYVLDPRHGLTESDLLSLVGFGIAGWGFMVTWRRSRRAGRKRQV
ncbi:hypothetical protein F1734_21535 [Rhodococcus ruber]|nr:hypothetical protein F1734_21535 [Rhodococcus ruber]